MEQLQTQDFDNICENIEFNLGFKKETFFPSNILKKGSNLLFSLGLMVLPVAVPSTRVPIMVGSFLFSRIKGQPAKLLLSGFFMIQSWIKIQVKAFQRFILETFY